MNYRQSLRRKLNEYLLPFDLGVEPLDYVDVTLDRCGSLQQVGLGQLRGGERQFCGPEILRDACTISFTEGEEVGQHLVRRLQPPLRQESLRVGKDLLILVQLESSDADRCAGRKEVVAVVPSARGHQTR